MILFQKLRIADGPNTYHYTELGPSLFHKVLMNKDYSVSLYSQNNPKVDISTMDVEISHSDLDFVGNELQHDRRFNFALPSQILAYFDCHPKAIQASFISTDFQSNQS